MTLFVIIYYYFIIIFVLFYIICVLNALFVLLSVGRVFEGTHPVCRQDGGAGSQWTGLRVV